MKILLDWDCKELDRGKRGSLSKAKYEVDIDTKEIELLELGLGDKVDFEEILKLAEKIKDLKNEKEDIKTSNSSKTK